MNGYVIALGVFEGNLIAAGGFTNAGTAVAHHIAAWNGHWWSSLPPAWSVNYWQPLGLGVGGAVHALTVHANRLVAGGAFAEGVSIWNGTDWSPLGTISPDVLELSIWEGDLVAGGTFPGGIAVWDGSSWGLLGSGVSGGFPSTYVSALAVYDGQLIVGGRFTTAGGVAANCIAAWDGIAWSPLGAGVGVPFLNDSVEGLAVYDGKLIAAGSFTTAGGVEAKRIAAWDGTTWSQVGSGVEENNPVQALAVFEGDLIVGGCAMTVGGVTATGVGRWNGTSWSAMGDFTEYPPYMEENPSGIVYALTVFNDSLIAGGYFQGASGAYCYRIAKWDGLSKWTYVWTGMNDEVHALTVFGHRLIAGVISRRRGTYGRPTWRVGTPTARCRCSSKSSTLVRSKGEWNSRGTSCPMRMSWASRSIDA